MPTIYEIDRIADLLRVPIERRTACLREVEYALALHELAFGEKAADVEIGPMRWTDDGDKTCTLHDASGKPVLTLEVTNKSDMQPNKQYTPWQVYISVDGRCITRLSFIYLFVLIA